MLVDDVLIVYLKVDCHFKIFGLGYVLIFRFFTKMMNGIVENKSQNEHTLTQSVEQFATFWGAYNNQSKNKPHTNELKCCWVFAPYARLVTLHVA